MSLCQPFECAVAVLAKAFSAVKEAEIERHSCSRRQIETEFIQQNIFDKTEKANEFMDMRRSMSQNEFPLIKMYIILVCVKSFN